MDKLGVERVERIMLAGAFGSHIDTKYAMVLGLIPDCALDHVHAVGNAAGTGARIALLNLGARAEIERVVRQVEKIETALEPQLPGAFRRRHGPAARQRPLPQPVAGGNPAGAEEGAVRGRRPPAAPRRRSPLDKRAAPERLLRDAMVPSEAAATTPETVLANGRPRLCG